MRRRTWIAVGVTTLGLVLFSYVPKLWSSARGFRGKMLVEQAGRWSRSSVNPPAILLVTAGALLAGATLLAVRQRRRNGKADALLARSGSAATAARRAGLSQDAVRMMWKVRSTTPAARGVEAARPTGIQSADFGQDICRGFFDAPQLPQPLQREFPRFLIPAQEP